MQTYTQTVLKMSHKDRLEELKTLQRIRQDSHIYKEEIKNKTRIILGFLEG